MAEEKYSWKPGSQVPVAADAAATALNAMIDKHGALTLQLVVDESRPEGAPLHPVFEWDDDKAAELYRQSQARYIIRSVVVEVVDDPAPPTRAFVSLIPAADKPEREYIYVRTRDALQDPDLRQQVLQRALEELQALRRRYHDLKELAQVFDAVDAVRETMQQVQPQAA